MGQHLENTGLESAQRIKMFRFEQSLGHGT
jgi:hypothetical protein